MEDQFMLKLNKIMQDTKFILVATAIKKKNCNTLKKTCITKP
ncbi:hypothetical protein HMPREF9370_0417 [Neisseria wadsworthii 9715]|uniref:Uncharacterized protein n=1 Tax=Neisseria wadsworthii 9715 TaxID=1030841 RepID=G4CMV8_9NEIS|nr:hypothetical protein HMPREF9370_0417 [Neisseria wadsworthii 9715]